MDLKNIISISLTKSCCLMAIATFSQGFGALAQDLIVPQQMSEVQADDTPEPNAWLLAQKNPHPPKISLGISYVHSRWSKFSSATKDGSLNLNLGFSREIRRAFEMGISFNFLNAAANSSNQENLYGMTVSVDSQFYILPGPMRPFIGLGMAFGSYRAWSLLSESATTIRFEKNGSGILYGVVPKLGLSCAMSAFSAIDIFVSYWGFLDNPAFKVGGPSVGLNFSFSR